MISGLGNIRRMQNFTMTESFCMVVLMGILFMLFSVPCVMADDELEKLEAEYEKLYKEYLHAREIVRVRVNDKQQDKYTEEDELEANFTIENFGSYGLNLATRIKNLGGEPDKIRKKVEAQQEESTKKLDLDKLKKEDFTPRQWGIIKYYKERIGKMEKRLKEVSNPEGIEAKSIRRRIEEYEGEIRDVLDQAPKRKDMRVPQGVKLRGTVDGKSIEKATPRKFQPWKVRPKGLDIDIDILDRKFVEEMTWRFHSSKYQWLNEMNKWLDSSGSFAKPSDLENEYYKIQDSMRALLLVQKEQWSFSEAQNTDAKLSMLCKKLVMTEKKILWLFGSHKFKMNEQDLNELALELALLEILKLANEDYSKLDQKLRDEEENIIALEDLHNRLLKYPTIQTGSMAAMVRLAHQKAQLLCMETFRQRHGELERKHGLVDRIIEQRLKRGLRRAQSPGYPFKIHLELVATRIEYKAQTGSDKDVTDAKKETLRQLMRTSAQKANFDKQWDPRNKVLRDGY